MKGDLWSAGACLQPPLSGSSWDGKSDSKQTSQVLLHLQRGAKKAHRANILLECCVYLALQTGTHLPRADGTGPGGVW